MREQECLIRSPESRETKGDSLCIHASIKPLPFAAQEFFQTFFGNRSQAHIKAHRQLVLLLPSRNGFGPSLGEQVAQDATVFVDECAGAVG